MITITPLTPAQKRVGAHLVRGLTTSEIADEEQLSEDTVNSYIRGMRQNLHCPPRASRAVLAHALLSHQQVPPPPPPHQRPPLEPDEHDQRLLRAHADHTRPADIARAALLPTSHLRARTDDLVRRAGADNTTHLIALAHAWGLFSGPDATAPMQRQAEPSGAAR
ncbi:LuxR C-terminal-related transcriptional regulator [Streptomyces sp. NPDC001743]|uniref:LuxR C-terminal-related transcriptional regulator n=1 Tax=Streptomyces sp. NPDC001743 TaxID=3154397 RepID=UPI003333BC2E